MPEETSIRDPRKPGGRHGPLWWMMVFFPLLPVVFGAFVAMFSRTEFESWAPPLPDAGEPYETLRAGFWLAVWAGFLQVWAIQGVAYRARGARPPWPERLRRFSGATLISGLCSAAFVSLVLGPLGVWAWLLD